MVFTKSSRLKYIMYSSPSLDNFICKLCYRWTVSLLLVFSFVVTCRLLLGDSFECTEIHFSRYYVNAKCYAVSTYIFPEKLNIMEEDMRSVDDTTKLFRKYQTYYSWVNLFFLVQAFIFYLPHLLWKSYEGGYMYRLTAGVQKFFDNEEKRDSELYSLAKYILRTQGMHKVYTYLYIIFEVFNFSFALGQILWLIDFFHVTGETLSPGNWSDFRNLHFPPAGFCEFKMPGPSGDLQKMRTRCEMPMSGLYMKMFLFLHAWYILLTIMTGMVLLYRIALLVPSFRVSAAKSFTCLCERSTLNSLCYRMSYADWFFMTRMQKTMTDIDFSQMIDKISRVHQGTEKQKDETGKLSLIEVGMKDFDSCRETSPV